MKYPSSFDVRRATSLPTTRFVCRAVISRYVKTVSSHPALDMRWMKLRWASGQASLPVACPVCLHEPMVPDDCRPNKALRTTIKVFLKKKVMERETARKKEALDKASATPATPATPLPDQIPAQQSSEAQALLSTPAIVENSDGKPGSRDVSRTPQGQDDGGSKIEGSVVPTDAQKDIPQESIEVGPLIPTRKRSQLTIYSLLVLRSLDETLHRRLVMVVLFKKRQMITKSKWSSSSSSRWVRTSSGRRTTCRGRTSVASVSMAPMVAFPIWVLME